jgi:hypothetical protein
VLNIACSTVVNVCTFVESFVSALEISRYVSSDRLDTAWTRLAEFSAGVLSLDSGTHPGLAHPGAGACGALAAMACAYSTFCPIMYAQYELEQARR